MKELSIKEKAKRYDEALERMRDFLKEWEDCGAVGIAMEKAKAVFPELMESEDERIRKELLQIAKESEDSFYMVMTPNKREKLIAWLENQGEQKNILEDAIIDSNEDGLIAETIRAKQGEQKPWTEEDKKQARQIERIVHNDGCTQKLQKQIADWLESLKGRVQPQPKKEWGEEDKENFNLICFYLNSPESAGDKYSCLFSWLKSIKDRVQPQPKKEWGEEDKNMIEDTIQFIEKGWTDNGKSHLIPWLKSLKDRYTWKPSEEQMEALNDVISSRDIKYDILSELWKDLKKLSEE